MDPVHQVPERLAVVEIDPRLEATPSPMSAARLRGVAWRRPGARGSHARTPRPVRSASAHGPRQTPWLGGEGRRRRESWFAWKVNLPSDHQYVQLHHQYVRRRVRTRACWEKFSGMSAVRRLCRLAERLPQGERIPGLLRRACGDHARLTDPSRRRAGGPGSPGGAVKGRAISLRYGFGQPTQGGCPPMSVRSDAARRRPPLRPRAPALGRGRDPDRGAASMASRSAW